MVASIYIVGPVGSGKSTLARRIAREYGYASCELDRIVYAPDPSDSIGNRKRSDAERDALLREATAHERWVVEDAGRAVFEDVLARAESVVLLEPPVRVRVVRILKRWVKQRLGREACGYTPTLLMLRLMFRWTRGYERGTDGLRERLAPYGDKVSVVRNEREIAAYVRGHCV